VSEVALPAVRYAIASIRREYAAVRKEQPRLTPWEAFAAAKQRSNDLIVAANSAIMLAEVERRYRLAKLVKPVGAPGGRDATELGASETLAGFRLVSHKRTWMLLPTPERRSGLEGAIASASAAEGRRR
jgi:hypothetical protein